MSPLINLFPRVVSWVICYIICFAFADMDTGVIR